MKVISIGLTSAEKTEAVDKANAIMDNIEDDYEYNSNHAIADSFEQWQLECNPCCGMKEIEITLSTNKVVYLCFDYGH
jgi:hypothetical protein